MRYGKLPPTGAMVSVTPLHVADLTRVRLVLHRVRQRDARRRAPQRRRAQRVSGGIGFAPAETKEYQAVFNSFPPRQRLEPGTSAMVFSIGPKRP